MNRMMVRGEPDYADQVPRRAAYEAAHPDVEISYHGTHWRAIVREQAAARSSSNDLKDLLDKLDEIT